MILIFCISLIVIPLAVPFSFPFLPEIPDLWETKDFLVLLFSLAFILTSKSPGNAGKNPWLMGLMIFLPISIYSSPPLELIYGYQNMGGMWQWRALAWCFLYFMLYVNLLGIPYYVEKNQKMIVRLLGWGAVISAIYALLQAAGLDQWQLGRDWHEIGNPVSRDIVANIGNPTYLACYLGICFPFVILYARWWWTVLVGIAIICCQSDFGTFGALLTIALICMLRSGKVAWLKAAAIIATLAVLLVIDFWPQVKPHVHDNSRFSTWHDTLNDWNKPSLIMKITPDMPDAQKKEIEILNKRNYAFTGRGLGSFPFIFSPKHQTKFDTPHCVPLRVLYETGLVGLILFLGSLVWIFWNAFKTWPFNKFKVAIFSSAFFICFCMIGIPLEVINPVAYISVAIFSILSAL